MLTHAPYILNNLLDTLLVGMGCVHPDNIHTRHKQLTDKLRITSAVTDASNNLCLFHKYMLDFMVQRYKKRGKERRFSSIFEKKTGNISVIY